MRLEDVTAEIRPRTDWEALDLGFAMVRRDFWRCYVVWWLAMLLPLAVAAWLLKEMPLWLVPLFWWWKPAGSRMVLFELSRRLFGEKPSWKAVFKQLPGAWFRRFFYRFVWARFSPWLPVTLAVEDLEGLRGAPYRKRTTQLAMRGDGAVMWIYLLADAAALWVAISLFIMAAMLLPEGQDGAWRVAWETFDINRPQDVPAVISWTAVTCLLIGMSLTDLFVIGAGFGVYVNNRTWLEGWDVELAFKRLGKRLARIAAMVLALIAFFGGLPRVDAQEERSEVAEAIQHVKRHPDFKVHEEIQKIPKKGTTHWLDFLGGAGQLGAIVAYVALALLLALIVWVIWRNRHAFKLRSSTAKAASQPAAAKVVMGMEVTAESLPKDIPSRVLELWNRGLHQEALALLYRGTISKVIDFSSVEIQESDTEGDCVRRVEAAGTAAHSDYFRKLTGVWMSMAYAGNAPSGMEVESLCQSWPFVERQAR
jgi:hypothetical protein